LTRRADVACPDCGRGGPRHRLHTHPYSETFVLLEGNGRWTAGETVVEMHPDQMLVVLVVPPNTPHGFRNIGDVPLLTVSIHESGEVDQTFLGVIRPDARRGSRG